METRRISYRVALFAFRWENHSLNISSLVLNKETSEPITHAKTQAKMSRIEMFKQHMKESGILN